MVDGPPPELSPVADCGLSADVGDPVGRAAGFSAPDGSAAGLVAVVPVVGGDDASRVAGADGSAGADVAPTALLKCMTGG